MLNKEDKLYQRVAEILDAARGQVVRSVNTAMVQSYWLIGREIILVEQGGEQRAGYGDEVLKQLAARLRRRFGKGWSLATLKRMRQFYQVFPSGSAIGSTALSLSGPAAEIGSTALSRSAAAPFPSHLSWSHYLVLLRVRDAGAACSTRWRRPARAGRCASSIARSHRSSTSVLAAIESPPQTSGPDSMSLPRVT